MKLKIPRSTLSSLLALPAAVAAKRTTMPVLSCVKLTVSTFGLLTVEATDLDVSVRQTVACETQASGSVCLDGRLLTQIVKDAAGDEVSFEAAKNARVTLVSGGASFTLVALAADEFPALPPMPEGAIGTTVPAGELHAALTAVAHAMSADESRYNLCGVCLEGSGGITRVVATDGHRMARTAGPRLPDFSGQFILPRAGVARILGFLTGGEEVNVVNAVTDLHFSKPDAALSVRLVDGTFPDVNKVITNSEAAVTFDLDRQAFLQSLRRVSLVTTDATRAVRLTATEAGLRVSSSSPEFGEAVDVVPAEVTGHQEGPIGLSGRYLADVLGSSDAARVRVEGRGATAPVCFRFEGDEAFVGVIMPLRTEG